MYRLVLFLAMSLFATLAAWAGEAGKVPSAGEALQRLKEGNERYVAHRLSHPDQTAERLHEVEAEQHPFAVILGCADSRVPPEIVFDQGLGDLFVIRVAGVVPDDEIIGSIEYAVAHLQTPLVVVLGHEKCGAVTAATGEMEKNHTVSFVKVLKNYVDQAKKQPGDLIHNAVCLSVDGFVQELSKSDPVLAPAVFQGKLKIVGARYDMHTGEVIWHGDSGKATPILHSRVNE